MIVRLTRRQYGRVIEVVEPALAAEQWRKALKEWWYADVSSAAKHRVDVAMPALGWKRVADVMFDHCFDNRGMRSKGVRTTDLNAMKAIRRALNVRETHPALHGIGAIGMIGELVPAWTMTQGQDGKPHYSPYPLVGENFVVLAPESHSVRNQTVTTWVPSKRSPERRLLNPDEHWRFF